MDNIFFHNEYMINDFKLLKQNGFWGRSFLWFYN